jgi:hypothetical protein
VREIEPDLAQRFVAQVGHREDLHAGRDDERNLPALAHLAPRRRVLAHHDAFGKRSLGVLYDDRAQAHAGARRERVGERFADQRRRRNRGAAAPRKSWIERANHTEVPTNSASATAKNQSWRAIQGPRRDRRTGEEASAVIARRAPRSRERFELGEVEFGVGEYPLHVFVFFERVEKVTTARRSSPLGATVCLGSTPSTSSRSRAARRARARRARRPAPRARLTIERPSDAAVVEAHVDDAVDQRCLGEGVLVEPAVFDLDDPARSNIQATEPDSPSAPPLRLKRNAARRPCGCGCRWPRRRSTATPAGP